MEIDREKLYQLYIVERKTTTEMAEMFGFKSSTSISKRLKEHNIPIRSVKEAQLATVIDKNIIELLYIQQELSIKTISIMLNTSVMRISRALDEFSIPKRDKTHKISQWIKGKTKETCESLRIGAEKLSKYRKEAFQNGTLKHWNQGNHWSEEVRMKISQKLSRGGPSYKDYGSKWKTIRTSRLIIDEFECQQCRSKTDLEVHHWEPYRFSFDNSMDNLVTLCKSCHQDIHKQYIKEGFIKDAEEAMYDDF